MNLVRRTAAVTLVILLIATLAAACASGNPTPTPMPTATAVPATPTPIPTPTPTVEPTATAIPDPTTEPAPVPGATSIVLAPVADATLYDRSSLLASNGSGEYLYFGFTDDNETRRALVRFDVAGAIPAGARIASAKLVLNVDRTRDDDVVPFTVHRVTAGWTEGASYSQTAGQGSGTAPGDGDVTWVHSTFPDVMWENPGGDFEPKPSSSTTVGAPPRGQLLPITWPSTDAMIADVQGWLDDTAGSYGWVVLGHEESRQTARRVRAREHEEGDSHPRLVIEYLP